MGWPEMGTSLYRSLLLSTGGFTVSDYIRKFTAAGPGERSAKAAREKNGPAAKIASDLPCGTKGEEVSVSRTPGPPPDTRCVSRFLVRPTMSRPATLASCIAKMYEAGRPEDGRSSAPSPAVKKQAGNLLSSLGGLEVKLGALEARVEQIASGQADVMTRLDSVWRSVGGLERDVARIGQEVDAQRGAEAVLAEVRALCVEMLPLLRHLRQEDRWHREKMEAADKALTFVVDVFRGSHIAEFFARGPDPWSGGGLLPGKDEKKDKPEDKPAKPRAAVCDRETQVEADDGRACEGEFAPYPQAPNATEKSKVSPPDNPTPGKLQPLRPAQGGDGGAKAPRRPKGVTLRSREPTRSQTFAKGSQDGADEGQQADEEPRPEAAPALPERGEQVQESTVEGSGPQGVPLMAPSQTPPSAPGEEQPEPPQSAVSCPADPANSKRPFTMVTLSPSGDSTRPADTPDPSHEAETTLQGSTGAGPPPTEVSRGGASTSRQHSLGSQPAATSPQLPVIDDCPPKPAPFEHRIVCAKQVPMGSYYAVKTSEVLGGGRFGQVHKCAELSSGLTLAAKIIKVKGMKDRDEVKNEIGVMNQLNHVNLIQLYDAFETRTNLTLIMEYVEGGELFDRIVDENYQLTELDAIVFVRQICEGVQYLHQQYILHLDLKPENILCVSTTGNQIKIIDFGLARKYRPREKLKVNFGTPEFLAPEVVNYDFVSFPTDMWSVGVITYMLLSGLSPFLGDNDTETMNNILHSNWDFDAEAFENVSEEAKDFISRLLIPEKCSRLSASGCVKHSWLNNLEEKAKMHRVRLKSQLHLQRYLAAHRQWKKHFHVVAAANRLKRLCGVPSSNPA
ncbi:myosin light chain kinase 3 isoform X2 [Arapaima gigas]